MASCISPVQIPDRTSHDGDIRHGLMPVLDSVFPLLLAITDDEPAAAAIRVTLALAGARGAVPTVVRALGNGRDVEVVVSPFVGIVPEGSLSPEYRDECRDSLQKQIELVAGDVRWRMEIVDEAPADAVIEHARQLRPELIVMGLRRHGVLHRTVSRGVLRPVTGATRLPVLAVTPELTGLPERIVVAVDFSEESILAARLARHLLADDGEMYLIHVATGGPCAASRRTTLASDCSAERVAEELDRLIEDLDAAPTMTITPVVATGDVRLSIAGCARRVGADLIAVGSDHHSSLDRLLSNSVSMGLAREARWSMLVVPSRHDD
jgi:nucleotide-binding universal stress UspA family protein